MPKNPYLINNNKPVEEVREIPTYQPKYTDEEVAKLKEIFIAEQKEEIKKYQIKTSPLSPEARSKVIRKWGDGYLSENQEGYGPCSPSYCNDCNCDRSDCNCRTNESFVKLWTACPAITCPGRNSRPRQPSHWVHATDNYYTWISNQARIRCERSYCSTNHMQNWKFRCSEHLGKDDYREVGKEAFQKALGWALTIEKDSSTNQVITDLIAWIVTHPKEWDR